MLQFKNINKSFGKLKALADINLSFAGNEVVAISGPNGSGKTTLLKSLLGLTVPDSGEILLDGKSVLSHHYYRGEIGYMSQISRFPENITISELFDMMKDIRQEVAVHDEELIEVYGLKNMGGKKLGTLSGGTRQKVNAALAFLFNPRIIILDEPTAGLDPASAEQLRTKIHQERNKGKLVLITSHIIADIEELADRVIYLLDGKIRFDSSIEEMKKLTGEKSFSKAMAKMTGLMSEEPKPQTQVLKMGGV